MSYSDEDIDRQEAGLPSTWESYRFGAAVYLVNPAPIYSQVTT